MNDEKYDGIEGFVKDLGCDVRECIDCGCLTPGGPTRCKRCAREEQLWLTYLGYLEQAKAARTIRDFRVVDYEKRIVEIQPYFSVCPLIKVTISTEIIEKV